MKIHLAPCVASLRVFISVASNRATGGDSARRVQVPLPVRGQSVNHLEGVPKCLTTKLGLLRSLAAFRCARSSHVVRAPDNNRVTYTVKTFLL